MLVILLGFIFVFIQPILGGIAMLIGVTVTLPAMIDYFSSEFGVTNKRVIIKVGFPSSNLRGIK